MANVPISLFTTVKPRQGAFVSTPSPIADGENQVPLNPDGSGNPNPVSFLGLTDTPTTYVSQGLKGVRVNSGEDGLEFFDFLGTPLTGYTVGANTALAATDTILEAFKKVQGQINARLEVAGTPTDTYVVTSVAGVPTWQAQSGGGGISDAPNDGLAYTRKSLAWTQLSPFDLKQEGATDGQFLAWNTANSRYQPITTGEWLVSGSDIYRRSRVAIGGTTLEDSQLTINHQSGVGAAFIINQIPRSSLLRNTIIIQDTDGKTPFNLENNGINTWKFFDGTNDKGGWKVDYGTSANVVTFKTSWDQNFTTDVTGFNFNPSNTSGSTFSWSMFIRGTTRFVMSASGKTAWNNGTAFASTATHQIRGIGDAIIVNFVNSTGTLAPLQVLNNGNCNMYDGGAMQFGTSTGYKLGSATNQKIGFWNKAPIIQPTTGITGATLAGGGGTTITDTHTFGGYTLQQIAAALINTGLLA